MLNRKQFLLLSSSGLLLPTVRAGAQNPPTRTPLPTDNALSVYIGVAATWQSLQTNAVRQREFSAEVSSYLLSETPTLENLQDHEIAFESLPPEPGWAVFAPQNNQFQFKFNITDARGRLGKIVVKALQSGTVLTQITAAADGASLVGVMLGDWNIAYYQIEGYDKTGNALFRLGATQGKFDTYVPFPISSGFVPNRPAFIPCAHYKAPDGLIGVEGDPYSVSGVVSGQSGTSRGCGYHDKVNDNSAPASIEPPDTFFQYIKHKKALDTASTNLGSFKSGDPQATQALVNLLTALTKEDATRALTNVDIPPYSDGCGHWHPAFSGGATAVYVIPYTRKKGNDSLLDIILGAIRQFLMPGTKILSALGIEALNRYLMTPQGAPYGYIQGEIRVVGDVYTVDTTEALKEPRLRPIMEDVAVTLSPDIAPPSGSGQVTIKNVGFWTTASPPGPTSGGTLNLSSPNYTGTIKLAKGYKWEVVGNLQSPMGYQPVNQPIPFQTPAASASIPVTLTALLQLKVYTVSDKNPTGPIGLTVQVVNAANQVVATGESAVQPDGRYAFSTNSTMPLTPGVYTINANRGGSSGTWKGSTSVTVSRGLLQEVNLLVKYTPPPHP